MLVRYGSRVVGLPGVAVVRLSHERGILGSDKPGFDANSSFTVGQRWIFTANTPALRPLYFISIMLWRNTTLW